MKFISFHSPAFSATVIRRQVGADLVDLLAALGEVMLTRGRALLWKRSVRCRTAYYRAAHRLRSAGLLIHRRARGQFPVLDLTAKGETRVSGTIFPERFWRRRWSGRWSVLVYDIPERERGYRQALQKFLQRQRMGCLQRSVWISPLDVRPLFDDLREAAEVDAYAVLFEARNVLGRRDADLAALAWNWEAINVAQARYITESEKRRQAYAAGQAAKAPWDVMRHELQEYHHAMQGDPLLPEALWPRTYQGPRAAAAFRRFLRTVVRSMLIL